MLKESGLIAFGDGSDATAVADAMDRFNEEVEQSADNVLVWSAVDGWEPLCEFLEVPVPEAPFPNVNDGSTFVDRIVDSALDALTAWRSPPG